MNKYFLKKDYIFLLKRIKELELELEEIGMDIKIACDQSSETWHDNFDYEEGKRKQAIVANYLNELLELKKVAVVKEKDEKMFIGKKIKFLFLKTNIEKIYFVSSYIVLDKKYSNEISYNSPLIESFIKANNNKQKKFLVNKNEVEIISID